MAEEVAAKLGYQLSPWEPCQRPESPGRWVYCNLTFAELSFRIGVSSGGVVSIDAHPFDPDGNMNWRPDILRHSLVDAVEKRGAKVNSSDWAIVRQKALMRPETIVALLNERMP